MPGKLTLHMAMDSASQKSTLLPALWPPIALIWSQSMVLDANKPVPTWVDFQRRREDYQILYQYRALDLVIK